jgi:predicted Zn-dependent peptidase
MKKLFLLVFTLTLYAISYPQNVLVQKYEPTNILENGQANIVQIPFSKYTFNNGLTLIVSEDHSNPLVNINVTYRVGSSNDYADRTGMSYMIYKLIDKGSRHLHSGEYQSIINQYGGKIFSEITRDRTTFSVTVPKNVLSTVLWMESDRQAYFLDSLTQEKFDNAKLDIIAAMYDSLYHQKYGLPDVLAQKNMYPFGHPYTWPEFGMMDHYQAFTITDLKKYFLDWYGSNNTILTITGDVKTQEVLDLVTTYFGTLTKAPQSVSYMDDLFNRIAGSGGSEYAEPRFISYKIDVPYPLIKIVFNTVPKFHQDEKTLNAIAFLLGQGKNSVLYNSLVKTGYAVSVNAQHKTYKYGGEFSIDVLAKPDTSLAVIMDKVNTILSDISRRRDISAYVYDLKKSNNPIILQPSNQQEIQPQPNLPTKPNIQPQPDKNGLKKPPIQPRTKEMALENREELSLNQSQSGELIFKTISRFKFNEVTQLESLQNKGRALAERELISGKPESISPSLIEYNEISPSRFYEIFNKYIMTGAKLYVSIVPKDKESLIASRDNIVERELKTILTPTLEQDLVYRYPTYDINKNKPKVADLQYNPDIKIKTDTAQNGMKVSLVQNNNFPIVCFDIRMDASKIMKLMPKLDVPKLLASKYSDWFEGQTMDNPLKAAAITGSDIEFIPNGQYVDIHVTCPEEHTMIVKESILQFLIRPEFSISTLYPQFLQKSNDTTEQKSFRKTNLGYVIQTLSSSNTPSTINTEDTLKKKGRSVIERKKLSVAFSNMYNPRYMTSFIYGKMDEGFYTDYVVRLATWQVPDYFAQGNERAFINPDSINVNVLKIPTEGNIFFLPDANNETAQIIVEYMQLPVEMSADYYTGKLANYIFGISSANQLSKKLRNRDYIQKIHTISYFRNKKECFAVVLNVNPDKFTEAYNDLMNELENFKTFKPEKSYFASVKNEYLYKDIVSNETFSQKERFISNLICNNIPSEIVNNQYAKTKKIKASKIAKFWKSAYNPKNARIVVIGNESQLQDKISKTGNNIIKIDKSGTVIN